MADIHSLKESISELDRDEASSLILTIRNERREAMVRAKSKSKKKRSSKTTTKKKSAKSLASDLSPEQAKELLKMLSDE